jgi:hypothetical protein
MKIRDLRAKGGIVDSALVPTEVTWIHDDDASGEQMVDTFTVHVRRMSVGWFDRALTAHAGDDQSRAAAMIAECVLMGDKGEEHFSYEEAHQLHVGLANALLGAIQKVNRRGPDAGPKASAEETSSGTS